MGRFGEEDAGKHARSDRQGGWRGHCRRGFAEVLPKAVCKSVDKEC
jgi:hypothetical protein